MKIYFDKEKFYKAIIIIAIAFYIISLLLGFSGVGYYGKASLSLSYFTTTISLTIFVLWFSHLLLAFILHSNKKVFKFLLSLCLIVSSIAFIFIQSIAHADPGYLMLYIFNTIIVPAYLTGFLLCIKIISVVINKVKKYYK